MSNRWYKENPDDAVWWLDNSDSVKGEWIFSFDRKRKFNLFADYPHKLTQWQKETFDRENPYWRDFFSDRK